MNKDILKYKDVVSVFDGMSCGQIALKENGQQFRNYYASELDKFAINQTQHNFPNTTQLGDVTKWQEWDIDWSNIGLFIGGSPCQGFSFAGKQLNFSDPRSALFFVYVDILNHIRKFNPDVLFLLENVNMKREYLRIISEYLGIYPVNINSNLVSAQNRNRWYWTNIKTKDIGLFSELWTDIPQPKDKGVLLKDVLESGEADRNKAHCLDANYFKGTSLNGYLNKGRRQVVFEAKNKKKVVVDLTINPPYTFHECRTEKGKKSRSAARKKTGRDISRRTKENKEYQPTKDGKANCLMTADSPTDYILDTDYAYRKLTPTECSRLQTIPEWYEWTVSDTQIYKMLGNGWTVEVIKHIFSFMN